MASSSEDEITALSPGSISAAPELHIAGFPSPPRNPEQSNLISSERNAGIRSQPDNLQLEGNRSQKSQPKSKAKPELTFTRVKPTTPAKQSLLTSVLAAQSSSPDNPFSELYASVAARGQDTYTLCVYFPNSKTPNKPMELTTQRDASVEEIIGFSLWNYWEERWKPDLDAGCNDDEEKKLRLSAVSWNLRIAEDDGEVDEDFPCQYSISASSFWSSLITALDRAKKISNFNFDAYAITLETSSAQSTWMSVCFRAMLTREQSPRMLSMMANSSAGLPASGYNEKPIIPRPLRPS
jgi:hypothetical protein